MKENTEKDSLKKRLFYKYDVVLKRRNGDSDEHRMVITRLGVLSIALLSALLVATLTVLLLFYTSLQSLMPGYVSPETHRQYLETALRMDSLAEVVQRHNMYVMNIQDIFRGEIRIDSVHSIDSLTILRSEELMERTEREKEFVRMYEEAEKYNLTSHASRIGEIYDLHMFTPASGVMGDKFDPHIHHYGIDILTSPDETAKAILDGSVLLSGYTAKNGYVVVIQHTGSLVSVYKHLGTLLKHEGEKVKSGEPVGVVITPDDKPSGSYLHFELWHKGVALDPTQYISF